MNRELDATIAKEIFNWSYIQVSSDANGENKCSILFPPNKTATQDVYNQPSPTKKFYTRLSGVIP